MRGLLVGLLGLGLLACGGTIDPPEARIQIQISEAWPTDDQAELLQAVDTWQRVLGPGMHLDVSVGDCIRGSMPGCLLPAAADDPKLQSASDTLLSEDAMPSTAHVVGLCERNDMLVQKDYPLRMAAALHELGHRLGLQHSDGIMNPEITGDTTITPTILAELASLGLR